MYRMEKASTSPANFIPIQPSTSPQAQKRIGHANPSKSPAVPKLSLDMYTPPTEIFDSETGSQKPIVTVGAKSKIVQTDCCQRMITAAANSNIVASAKEEALIDYKQISRIHRPQAQPAASEVNLVDIYTPPSESEQASLSNKGDSNVAASKDALIELSHSPPKSKFSDPKKRKQDPRTSFTSQMSEALYQQKKRDANSKISPREKPVVKFISNLLSPKSSSKLTSNNTISVGLADENFVINEPSTLTEQERETELKRLKAEAREQSLRSFIMSGTFIMQGLKISENREPLNLVSQHATPAERTQDLLEQLLFILYKAGWNPNNWSASLTNEELKSKITDEAKKLIDKQDSIWWPLFYRFHGGTYTKIREKQREWLGNLYEDDVLKAFCKLGKNQKKSISYELKIEGPDSFHLKYSISYLLTSRPDRKPLEDRSNPKINYAVDPRREFYEIAELPFTLIVSKGTNGTVDHEEFTWKPNANVADETQGFILKTLQKANFKQKT